MEAAENDEEFFSKEKFTDFHFVQSHLRSIGTFPLLNREEELALAKKWRNKKDPEAFDALVNHNLRFVVSIAKRYRGSGLDFADLIQEGTIGLITALKKYDHRMGFKVTTYAGWWIRQSIQRAIQNDSRTIRIPTHVLDDKRAITKAIKELSVKLGRKPALKEVASQTQMKESRIQDILDSTKQDYFFLDDAAAENNLGEIEVLLSAENSLPEARLIIESELALIEKKLRQFISSRSLMENKARNIDIFRSFYGIDGTGIAKTLEDCGEKFSVTRERIRQIIEKIWKEKTLGMNEDNRSFLEALRSQVVRRNLGYISDKKAVRSHKSNK